MQKLSRVLFVLVFISACGGEATKDIYIGASPPEDSNTVSTASSDSTTTVTDSTSVAVVQNTSAATEVIDKFLWKPQSEKDGKLVVLVNPSDVRVEVIGNIAETLKDYGASNGYGTTARGSFEGCDYGGSVVVEFFDSSNKRIQVVDGRRSITVEDPCKREEFNL